MLDRSFSPGTENAIIDAIKSAGIVTPWSGKIGVEIQDTSGAYTVPSGAQIFLDTGASNKITVTTSGATLLAAGDGSVSMTDKGPGGDTLVGGAGAELLKVTHGENVLIGGSGENTLIGGAGHDTLIGGGSSLLEAGSGGSTLIGGPLDQSAGDERSRDHGRGDRNGWPHSDPGPPPSDTLMGEALPIFFRCSMATTCLSPEPGTTRSPGATVTTRSSAVGHDTINIDYGNEFVQGGGGIR